MSQSDNIVCAIVDDMPLFIESLLWHGFRGDLGRFNRGD